MNFMSLNTGTGSNALFFAPKFLEQIILFYKKGTVLDLPFFVGF